MFLLDTTVCIDVFKGRPSVIKKMTALAPDDVAVSAISIYELYVGAAKCRRPQDERKKIAHFLSLVHELSFEHADATEAGQLRAELESKGLSIGPYDILIAAQGLRHGLTVVTSNSKEFKRVPGLVVDDWRT